MAVDPFTIATGVAAVGQGIASIIGGSNKDKAERKGIKQQFEYDTEMWEYNDDERIRDNEYRQESVEINRQNASNNIAYEEATAARQYAYDVALQNYRFDLAMREYQQSEQNYKLQLGFNNLAAAQAYESEQRAFNEIMTAQAFAREDNMADQVQARGAAKLLTAGRSSTRQQALSLAQSGRTIARLDASFRSAQTETQSNLNDVAIQKYGADLRANANRILEPQRLPELPKPLALPRPIFQDAYQRDEAPKPRKGVASGGGLLAGIASAAGSFARGAQQIDAGLKA